MTNEITVVLVVLLVFAILGGVFSPMTGIGYGMMGWSSPFFFFGWIICALVIVALALFILWLFKQLSGEEHARSENRRNSQRRSR